MDVWTLLRGGGPVAIVLLALSLYAATVFFFRWQVLRRAGANPGRVLEGVRADVLAGSVRNAVASALRSDSSAARVIAAGLERTHLGREAVHAALSQAATLEEERVGRGLSTLATVAQVAPMLGLLGTVFGMIRSFTVFSNVSQPSPAQLAGGISEALITTASGLIVAILAHVGHSVLSRQFESVLGSVDRARESLVGWLLEAGLFSSKPGDPFEVSMTWPAEQAAGRG